MNAHYGTETWTEFDSEAGELLSHTARDVRAVFDELARIIGR
jgi:hypothetical protein